MLKSIQTLLKQDKEMFKDLEVHGHQLSGSKRRGQGEYVPALF